MSQFFNSSLSFNSTYNNPLDFSEDSFSANISPLYFGSEPNSKKTILSFMHCVEAKMTENMKYFLEQLKKMQRVQLRMVEKKDKMRGNKYASKSGSQNKGLLKMKENMVQRRVLDLKVYLFLWNALLKNKYENCRILVRIWRRKCIKTLKTTHLALKICKKCLDKKHKQMKKHFFNNFNHKKQNTLKGFHILHSFFNQKWFAQINQAMKGLALSNKQLNTSCSLKDCPKILQNALTHACFLSQRYCQNEKREAAKADKIRRERKFRLILINLGRKQKDIKCMCMQMWYREMQASKANIMEKVKQLEGYKQKLIDSFF